MSGTIYIRGEEEVRDNINRRLSEMRNGSSGWSLKPGIELTTLFEREVIVVSPHKKEVPFQKAPREVQEIIASEIIARSPSNMRTVAPPTRPLHRNKHVVRAARTNAS
ncbi:hypothetical protein IT397_02580 [Candidatus Nomurabacteria bacterium]|nr:hypothetical protein [Candidatus Nomurabacteria bacterium]